MCVLKLAQAEICTYTHTKSHKSHNQYFGTCLNVRAISTSDVITFHWLTCMAFAAHHYLICDMHMLTCKQL